MNRFGGRILIAALAAAGGFARGNEASAQSTGASPAPNEASSPSMTPARVRVIAPACSPGPFAIEPFIALLRIELAADGVERLDVAAAGETGIAEVSLATITFDIAGCDPNAREVVVGIDDAATRKSVRRAVELADVPSNSRPRVLALAVAELLRASWAELALPDVPAPSQPVPIAVRRAVVEHLAPATRAPGAIDTARERVMVLVVAEARFFPQYLTGVFGGRAASSIPLHAAIPLRFRIDAGLLLGTVTDRNGQIDLGLASVGAGLSVAGGGRNVGVEFGPRVEVGWGWLAGRATSVGTVGDTGGGAVVNAAMTGTLRVRVGARWWTLLEVEIGSAILGLVASVYGTPTSGFAGPMVGLRLGIAVEP